MTAGDIKEMSFENAVAELESIVNGFESGQIDLEKAIDNYSRGAALQKHCERKLSEAKLKVQKIIEKSDGSIATEKFDSN